MTTTQLHGHRNLWVIATVTTTDGAEHVIRFRNSLRGWANALVRAGIHPRQIVDIVDGLPESARVPS